MKEIVGRLGSGTEFTVGFNMYILEVKLADVFDDDTINDITSPIDPAAEAKKEPLATHESNVIH